MVVAKHNVLFHTGRPLLQVVCGWSSVPVIRPHFPAPERGEGGRTGQNRAGKWRNIEDNGVVKRVN